MAEAVGFPVFNKRCFFLVQHGTKLAAEGNKFSTYRKESRWGVKFVMVGGKLARGRMFIMMEGKRVAEEKFNIEDAVGGTKVHNGRGKPVGRGRC